MPAQDRVRAASRRSPCRRALGIMLSRVASRARSAQSSFGRRGCRRCSAASWWRRIKISVVFHVSSRRVSRSHAATRVIKRNTNRRHMIGDHHGRTAGEQLCWSEPWTGFSARTGCEPSFDPRRGGLVRTGALARRAPGRAGDQMARLNFRGAVTTVKARDDGTLDHDRASRWAPTVGQGRSRYTPASGVVRRVVGRRPRSERFGHESALPGRTISLCP